MVNRDHSNHHSGLMAGAFDFNSSWPRPKPTGDSLVGRLQALDGYRNEPAMSREGLLQRDRLDDFLADDNAPLSFAAETLQQREAKQRALAEIDGVLAGFKFLDRVERKEYYDSSPFDLETANAGYWAIARDGLGPLEYYDDEPDLFMNDSDPLALQSRHSPSIPQPESTEETIQLPGATGPKYARRAPN